MLPAVVVFFFNDTATTEIYTLSLHDALPISPPRRSCARWVPSSAWTRGPRRAWRDRKSTRLNSSHANISYAVFCLKNNNHHNARLLIDHKLSRQAQRLQARNGQ